MRRTAFVRRGVVYEEIASRFETPDASYGTSLLSVGVRV